jgi:hypothetical protein
MQERQIFRVGIRIVGVFFLGWFVTNIPVIVVQAWQFVAGLLLTVSHGSGFTGADGPFGVLIGIAQELLRLLANCAEGIVAWYLLFRGQRLINKVYPEAADATPPTTA